MEIIWLGHSAFHVKTKGIDLLIDPFFTGNGTFPAGYEDKLEKVDLIAVTHGHGDHLGDTVRLAQKHDAVVVCIYEIMQYLKAQGVEKISPLNIGGGAKVGALQFAMTHAQHSASAFSDGQLVYLGVAAGLVIDDGEQVLYHAGDTGLFSDMALIQRLYKPTIGILPIGDRLTMGPEHAAIACNEFLELDHVLPCHYGTFPFLSGQPDSFRALVRRGQVHVPAPGEVVTL